MRGGERIGGGEVQRRKKGTPGQRNNPTDREDVGAGVLAQPTKEARVDKVNGDAVLMPHASGGGQGVVSKAHMMGEQTLGRKRDRLEVGGKRGNNLWRGGGGEEGWLELRKE